MTLESILSEKSTELYHSQKKVINQAAEKENRLPRRGQPSFSEHAKQCLIKSVMSNKKDDQVHQDLSEDSSPRNYIKRFEVAIATS